MQRDFNFDTIAHIYEAARPEYPTAVFDQLCHAAALEPGAPVLEVGCGTGKATWGLAAQGWKITALDPGEALLGLARDRLGGAPGVQFEQATFESWVAPPAAFRLVVAAQAWHWLDPQIAFPKAAETLAADGVLAIFGNVPQPSIEPLAPTLSQAYAKHAPELMGPPAEAWYNPEGPVAGMFQQSGLFAPATHKAFAWSQTHTAESYVRLLDSLSYVQRLPAPRREALLGAISAGIEAHGGRIERAYLTHLYWARRL